MHRLAMQFPESYARLEQEGFLADSQAGRGKTVVEVGMRTRLTRNMDKQRGSVNGALGYVAHVIDKAVFILKTMEGVHILAHLVCISKKHFGRYEATKCKTLETVYANSQLTKRLGMVLTMSRWLRPVDDSSKSGHRG